jgi:HK97 family phage prohead protease
LEVRDDGVGLWIRGAFHTTPDAVNARTIAAERKALGFPLGLSIGYIPLAARDSKEGRYLTKVYLVEVSLVSIPANVDALLTGVKHPTTLHDEELRFQVLRARQNGVRV